MNKKYEKFVGKKISPDLILELATFAHKGQKRWDGGDYIHHPIEVSHITKRLINAVEEYCDPEVVEYSALLHDVIEDTDLDHDTLYEILSGDNSFCDHAADRIMQTVRLLTRCKGESYLVFILVVNTDPYSRIVKIADLLHNLSDLKKGSLRDKYIMALHLLGYNDMV